MWSLMEESKTHRAEAGVTREDGRVGAPALWEPMGACRLAAGALCKAPKWFSQGTGY